MRLATERFAVWRADASRIFCIALPRPTRSDEMLSGYRARSGMARRRRSGSSSAAESWRSSSVRPIRLLLGRHLLELGVQPGPQMGEITRAVYEMQLDGRVRTLEEAIGEAKKIYEIHR